MCRHITSIVSKRNPRCTGDNSLMPKEQTRCGTGSEQCTDQLQISKAILQECKISKKNLCVEWLDYGKTCYSVRHGWIVRSLELIWINNKITSFTKKTVNYWKPGMRTYAEERWPERPYSALYFPRAYWQYLHFCFLRRKQVLYPYKL
jgi:hypothetical protein